MRALGPSRRSSRNAWKPVDCDPVARVFGGSFDRIAWREQGGDPPHSWQFVTKLTPLVCAVILQESKCRHAELRRSIQRLSHLQFLLVRIAFERTNRIG